jgi:hypothetical protein
MLCAYAIIKSNYNFCAMIIKKQIRLACLLILATACMCYGQEEKLNGVRISGVVVDADDHEPVPYVNINISGTMYGAAADNNGYFSLFINPGDTLLFSAIGYRKSTFIMPFEVTTDNYSLVQLMRQETVLLNEVVVFPWPTIESLEQAFLEAEPEQGMEDIIREVKKDLKETVNESERNEYYYDQMRYNKLYELHGDIPPNNFLNPSRWANFIRDLKKGEFEE